MGFQCPSRVQGSRRLRGGKYRCNLFVHFVAFTLALFLNHLVRYHTSRPVARIFYGWVRSVDYTDQRAPEALFTRGVRGHAPPPREILKIKLSETAFRAF